MEARPASLEGAEEEPPASGVVELEERLPHRGTVRPKDPRPTGDMPRARDQMPTKVPLPDGGGAWRGRGSRDGDLMPEERDFLSMVWRPLVHHLEKDPEYIYWVPPVYRLTLDILLRRKRQLMSTTEEEESSGLQSTYIEDSETHMETPSGAEDKLKISKSSSSSSRDSGRFSEEDPLSPYMTKTEIYALSDLPLDRAFQKELQHVLRNRARTSFLEEEALGAKVAREAQGLSPDGGLSWSTTKNGDPRRFASTRADYFSLEEDLVRAKTAREVQGLYPDGGLAWDHRRLDTHQGVDVPTKEKWGLSSHPVESPSVVEQHLAPEEPQEQGRKNNPEDSVSLSWHDPELPGKDLPLISKRPDFALSREPSRGSRGDEDLDEERAYGRRSPSPHENQKLLSVHATRYHSNGDYSHFEEIELSSRLPPSEDGAEEEQDGGSYYRERRSDPPVPVLLQLRLSLLGMVLIFVLGCVFMAVLMSRKLNSEQEEMTKYTSPSPQSV